MVCSVTSTKSSSEKQHKRTSSLGNQQEVLHLQTQLLLNRSSPEFGVGEKSNMQEGGKKGDEEIQPREQSSKTKSEASEGSSSRPKSDGVLFNSERGRDGNDNVKSGKNDDSVFMQGPSIEEIDEVVTPSFKTALIHPTFPSRSLSVNSSEDASSVVTTREDRAGTIHSDISGSCSTLQNERPEGEIDSSLEQSRKQQQQMSVSFRRELLSASQVKTESRVGLEVAKMTESDFDLVQLLGRSLPHIVPIVPLSKREVCVVCVTCVSHDTVWLNSFACLNYFLCVQMRLTKAIIIIVDICSGKTIYVLSQNCAPETFFYLLCCCSLF